MEWNIFTVVIAIVAGVIFLFIARKLLRLALKLMFVGAIIVMLLVLGGLGWWNGWFGSAAHERTPRPANTRRATH